EDVAALQLIHVEMNEAFVALLGEVELIVGLRRRRADVPHRECRVLEQRVGGAALAMDLDQKLVAGQRGMNGLNLRRRDVAPMLDQRANGAGGVMLEQLRRRAV